MHLLFPYKTEFFAVFLIILQNKIRNRRFDDSTGFHCDSFHLTLKENMYFVIAAISTFNFIILQFDENEVTILRETIRL